MTFPNPNSGWKNFIAKATREELDANLCVCAHSGDLQQVKDLLATGANPRADQSDCLNYAIHATIKTLQCLIDAGADINAQPFLCRAIARGKSEAAVFFIKQGADTTLQFEGLDASGWATELSDMAVIDALHALKGRAAAPGKAQPEAINAKIRDAKNRARGKFRL